MQFYFQKYDKPKFVLCLAFATNGDVITGDSNGNIYIWGKGKITQLLFDVLNKSVDCYWDERRWGGGNTSSVMCIFGPIPRVNFTVRVRNWY